MTVSMNIADSSKKLELNENVFAATFNEGLIHQVITAYKANGRSGTKKQKTRSEVSGGGAKPWKQKGTGRARAGTIRSPIWRSGGVTFAARTDRNYKQKINRNMYRAAMRSIFSELLRLERIRIVDDFKITEPKTKLMLDKLKSLDVTNDTLILTTDVEQNAFLAGRNIPHLEIREAATIDPVALLQHQQIVMTVPAAQKIEELLA